MLANYSRTLGRIWMQFQQSEIVLKQVVNIALWWYDELRMNRNRRIELDKYLSGHCSVCDGCIEMAYPQIKKGMALCLVIYKCLYLQIYNCYVLEIYIFISLFLNLQIYIFFFRSEGLCWLVEFLCRNFFKNA